MGQAATVSANLKSVAPEKLLTIAESDYQAGRYKETLSNCRLILERNADEPSRANLLMDYAYFYSQRLRESRFYLARAAGLRQEAEIPARIYQKENGEETLTDGVLKINRGSLSFASAKRPELNFTAAP